MYWNVSLAYAQKTVPSCLTVHHVWILVRCVSRCAITYA